jgi:hypothetical protein
VAAAAIGGMIIVLTGVGTVDPTVVQITEVIAARRNSRKICNKYCIHTKNRLIWAGFLI